LEKSSDSDPRKPISNNISHEQAIWVDSKTSTQRIDFVVQRVQELLKAVLALSCFVPIEVKPLGRKQTTLADLHEEGVHQVIGHLAKEIYHYLHLGGVGCDHVCRRGAVLTLVSVEIIEMELSGVGTENVTLRVRRTQPHLLFDEETTQHLLGNDADNDADVSRFVFDATNPFRGFEMLAELMRMPSREESPLPKAGQLQYIHETLPGGVILETFLGAGGFCFVYSCRTNNTFVKIPRSPRVTPMLQKEMEALSILGRGRRCPYVPEAPQKTLGTVTFRRLCETSRLPGLYLSGIVGTAASEHRKFSLKELCKIFDCVRHALKHAHGKGVFHLDVRPSNIIVRRKLSRTTLTFDVMLSDWGCAKLRGDQMKGFWGSVAFAHDEIHMNAQSTRAWKPMPKYDFASLAFTMVALISDLNNEVPWPEFYGNKVNNDMLEKRRKKSLEVITASLSSEPHVLRVLEDYLPADNTVASLP
jgi:hypothetical protein